MTSRTSRVTGLCSVCIKVSEVELLTVLDQNDLKTEEINELRARHQKSDGHLLAENAKLKQELEKAQNRMEFVRAEAERLRKERDLLSQKKKRRKRGNSNRDSSMNAPISAEEIVVVEAHVENEPKTEVEAELPQLDTEPNSNSVVEPPKIEIVPDMSESPSYCLAHTVTFDMHSFQLVVGVVPAQLSESSCLLETWAIQVFGVVPIDPQHGERLCEEHSTTFAVEVHTPPTIVTAVLEHWSMQVIVCVPPTGEGLDSTCVWETHHMQLEQDIKVEHALVDCTLENWYIKVYLVVPIEHGTSTLLLETLTIIVHKYEPPSSYHMTCLLEYFSQDIVLPVPLPPYTGELLIDTHSMVLQHIVRVEVEQAEVLLHWFRLDLVYPVPIDTASAWQEFDTASLVILPYISPSFGFCVCELEFHSIEVFKPHPVPHQEVSLLLECFHLLLQDIIRVEVELAEVLLESSSLTVHPHVAIPPVDGHCVIDSWYVQVFLHVPVEGQEGECLFDMWAFQVFPCVAIPPVETVCFLEYHSLEVLIPVRVQFAQVECLLDSWYVQVFENFVVEGLTLVCELDCFKLEIFASVVPSFWEANLLIDKWRIQIHKMLRIEVGLSELLWDTWKLVIHNAFAVPSFDEVLQKSEDCMKITNEELEEYLKLAAALQSRGEKTSNKRIAMAKLKLEEANKPVESELERVFRKRDRKYEAFEATSGSVTGKEEGEFGTNDVKKYEFEAPQRRSTLPVANVAIVEESKKTDKNPIVAGPTKPKTELPADADDLERINHFLGKDDSALSTLDNTMVGDDSNVETPASKSPTSKKVDPAPKDATPKAKPAVTSSKVGATKDSVSPSKTGTLAPKQATPTTGKIVDTRTASKTVASPVKPATAKVVDEKPAAPARKPGLDTGLKKPFTATATAPAKQTTAATTPGKAVVTPKAGVGAPKPPAPPAPPKKPVAGAQVPAPPPKPTGVQTKKIEDEDLLADDDLLNGFLNDTKPTGFEANGLPQPAAAKPTPATTTAPSGGANKKVVGELEDDFMNEFIEDTKNIPPPKKVEKTGDDLLDEFLEMETDEPADDVSAFAANFLQGTKGGTRGGSKNQGQPDIPTAAFGRLTSRR